MSKATQLECKASRELASIAIQILRSSERGQRTLACLRALLASSSVIGMDRGSQNAVRILVGETLNGNTAWLADPKNFSSK